MKPDKIGRQEWATKPDPHNPGQYLFRPVVAFPWWAWAIPTAALLVTAAALVLALLR